MFAPVAPPTNLDVWDIGHALLGFAFGTIQIKRWFAYPVKVAWEIYQIFTHYSHLSLQQTFINTIFDFAVFAAVYEGMLFIARRLDRTRWGRSLSADSKGVASFIAMAFGGAFIMAWDLERSQAPKLMQLTTVVVPIALCPGIAAFLTRWLKTEEKLWDTGTGLKRWGYSAGAILTPMLIAVVAQKLAQPAQAMVPGWLEMTFIKGDSGGLAGLLGAVGLIVQLLLLTGIVTPVMLVQEYGWRGYLQRRIFKKRPVAAAVATGLIWGLWLALITQRAYRLGWAGMPEILALVTAGTVSLSVILGWLEEKTGGIWAGGFLHAAAAAAGGTLIIAPIYFSSKAVWVSALGAWFLIPIALMAVLVLILCRRLRGEQGGPLPRTVEPGKRQG